MGGGEFLFAIVMVAYAAVSLLAPIVLAVMLIFWLTNKRRRDEELIARLAVIRQAVERIEERIPSDSRANGGGIQ